VADRLSPTVLAVQPLGARAVALLPFPWTTEVLRLPPKAAAWSPGATSTADAARLHAFRPGYRAGDSRFMWGLRLLLVCRYLP
jgi:hypothetical protein